jgi:hypothetical protein
MKFVSMVGITQMGKFMDDDVPDEVNRQMNEFFIQDDDISCSITAAPT